MMHLEITLSPRAPVNGQPVPLPGWAAALGLSPAETADLTDRGYPDSGYLLVWDEPPPVAPSGSVVERDGWTLGDTWAKPAWTTRPMTEEEVAALLARQVASVKAEAGRRILAVAPEWQQRNLTARAAELALLYPGTRGDELPEPERTEYLAGQSVWEQIKGVRTASNDIEAALVASPDPAAFDIAAGWPG